jgi:hypothetical protein
MPEVPADAIATDGEATFVRYPTARPRSIVKVGATWPGAVPVVEGSEGGEVIVVDAPRRLRAGAAVSLQGSAMSAATDVATAVPIAYPRPEGLSSRR